ncbi:MAG: A24 family peptidase [Bdellovibrionales bacterium]
MPLDFIAIGLFIFGSLLGSFANVIIYRLPQELSVVTPRSHCYSCKKMIAMYDNIPIFSWLFLRGKCRQCRAPFSIRYPFVEFLMGFLFLLLYWHVGWSWLLLEYCILTFGLVTISFIDLDHRIIPDVFSLSGIVLGLLGAALNPEREFMDAFLGFLMGGGFLWLIAYIYFVIRKEDGMGGGDIKLLAWLGAYLGWKAIPFIILSSSLVGTVAGLILIARGGNMKSSLPFGPFIVLGAYIYIFGGDQLANWYISLFLPSL